MSARLHRPYAAKPNLKKNGPSVTTVLGVLDKGGLPWAAANETADFAVNHQDQWLHLPPEDAYRRLRVHHRGVWDHRAALGSLVHEVNETWTYGEEIDLEAKVLELQANPKHCWARMSLDQVLTEVNVMIDGLEAAWSELTPETISAEDVVRHPTPQRQAYIGQADWRARVPMRGTRRTALLDLKTTGKLEDKEALYWDSWRLQLAAYRGCKEIVVYDDDANEVGVAPLPPVETCGILHIRANGKWNLHEVAAGGTEHNQFLRLVDTYYWLKSVKDGGVSHLPQHESENAA